MKIQESDKNISADDVIYRQVYLAIIEQKLRPGAKLKEDELCEIFNTGRSRIRKILARLERDKVVTLINNRGAFVAMPTIDEAREVFTARRLVECHLVRILAETQDPRCRKILEERIELEQRAAQDKNNFAASIWAGGKFHLALAELTNSQIIGDFLRELISRTSLICAAYERGTKAECELEEHRKLISYILDGRADDAVALIKAHLDGIESRLDLTPPSPITTSLRDALGR